LQKVFKLVSKQLEDISKDFIEARDFKESFYPGRRWKREEFDDKTHSHMYRKNKDDDENLSEASMLID
jgi:hypothetical protein